MSHVHFEGISLRPGSTEQFYIADGQGYVLYVTSVGKTIKEAQEKVYDIIQKIVIPRMFYRNDIGSDFAKIGMAKLKKWGYF